MSAGADYNEVDPLPPNQGLIHIPQQPTFTQNHNQQYAPPPIAMEPNYMGMVNNNLIHALRSLQNTPTQFSEDQNVQTLPTHFQPIQFTTTPPQQAIIPAANTAANTTQTDEELEELHCIFHTFNKRIQNLEQLLQK